jgi:hypothetical protein
MPHVDFSCTINGTSGRGNLNISCDSAPVRRHRVDHGVCCTGCYVRFLWMYAIHGRHVFVWNAAWDDKMRERLYSREGFLTHFRSCREAQQLWKASRGGTVAVKLERKNWKWLWENGDASRDALSQFRVPWAKAKKARERGVAGDA